MDYSWVERDAAKIAAGGMDVRLPSRPKPGNDGNFGRVEAIDLKTKLPLTCTLNRSIRWRTAMGASAAQENPGEKRDVKIPGN
jgi:hypothetical protein